MRSKDVRVLDIIFISFQRERELLNDNEISVLYLKSICIETRVDFF